VTAFDGTYRGSRTLELTDARCGEVRDPVATVTIRNGRARIPYSNSPIPVQVDREGNVTGGTDNILVTFKGRIEGDRFQGYSQSTGFPGYALICRTVLDLVRQ
jgi:hypothetical protein